MRYWIDQILEPTYMYFKVKAPVFGFEGAELLGCKFLVLLYFRPTFKTPPLKNAPSGPFKKAPLKKTPIPPSLIEISNAI